MKTAAPRSDRPSAGRLVGIIFLPMFLVQTGLGMGMTFVPLYARELGASLALAGIIPALNLLGMALMDIPSGWLVGKFGERRASIVAGVVLIAALLLRSLRPTLPALAVSAILFGMGNSVWWIGRMSWMKRHVRGTTRGRTMSLMGGTLRASRILGPLIGGAVAEILGYPSLYLVQSLITFVAVAVIFIAMPREYPEPVPYGDALRIARDTWRDRRRTIAAAVLGVAALSLLRSAWTIIVPLWGQGLGLSESRIGFAVSAGGIVDFSFFWLSGILMDRRGRKTSVVACTLGITVGLVLVPLTGGLTGLVAVSAIIGLSNAMGAGINLTISGDLAPREAPAVFLSAWRFVIGIGGAVGPAAVGVIAQAFRPGVSPLAVAAVGLTSAVGMIFFMGETHIVDKRKKSKEIR
jgi:MFS family permease